MYLARPVLVFLAATLRRLERWTDHTPLRSEAGMTTAELLGNAALGIAALVAIWGVLQVLGLDVMTWIRGQLRV
jgi:hypothetical protein